MESNKQSTAFEANGRLNHFCWKPFGIMNKLAAFQQLMNKLTDDKNWRIFSPT